MTPKCRDEKSIYAFIILLDCTIWSLNTFKLEWVMGFYFPWPILLCIDTQFKIYCRIPIILFGRPRVIKYNNFVLSATKPNHIKSQRQIKITRYCQIRELKQDTQLVRSEESQIGFQSWVTNACDPRSDSSNAWQAMKKWLLINLH